MTRPTKTEITLTVGRAATNPFWDANIGDISHRHGNSGSIPPVT